MRHRHSATQPPEVTCPVARTNPETCKEDSMLYRRDDGERLSCKTCGESFNVRESGSETYCLHHAPYRTPYRERHATVTGLVGAYRAVEAARSGPYDVMRAAVRLLVAAVHGADNGSMAEAQRIIDRTGEGAYEAGKRAGAADRRLERRNEYAWFIDRAPGYSHDYSVGYRDGWLNGQEGE